MRRSTLAVLTTVSLAALVSVATRSEAVQSPSVILGVLKPAEEWKVGTVNVTGASFCAMVNKYDSGVGLAFARSPEGYGTVAVDLHQSVFTQNNTYDVHLKIDGGATRKLQGRATSPRSLVIQIGQDQALYDALNANGTMEISMNVADVSFALTKFSSSFKSLSNCSSKLAAKQQASRGPNDGPKVPAVKVQEVEQASLAPIDREVQKLNGGAKTQVAQADQANSLDAQLDAAANAKVQATKDKIATLDRQHEDVTQQINASQQQAAQLQEQKQQVERKLLASIHTQTPPVPSANTGAVAKLWDEQQAAAAAQRKADELTQTEKQAQVAQAATLQQAVATKDAQIATMEDTKAAAAQKTVADAGAQQAALDKKTAKLEKQRDAIAAKADADTGNKALRASLVAKEAQLADIAAQRTAERDQLTQKLATTETSFEGKIASLTAERDSLRTQLASATAEVAKWQQADAADRAQAKEFQTKLAQSDEMRHGLETRVAELSAQKDKLAAAATETMTSGKEAADAKAQLDSVKHDDAAKIASLEARVAELSAQKDKLTASASTATAASAVATADSKELAEAKAALDSLKTQDAAQLASVQEKLSDKSAQFDALKSQFDALKAANPKLAQEHQQLTDLLAQKQSQIDSLHDKLAQIESDRATEASKAEVAKADLDATRQQLSGMRKGLVVVDDSRVIPAQRDALPDAARAQAELANLRKQNAELTNRLASETQPAAGGDDKAQAELAALRQKNAELSQQLALDATKPEGVPGPDVQKAQAELAAVKAQNADLAAKLAVATQATAQKSPEAAKAGAELAELRAKNAELTSRLASAAQAPAKDPALDKANTELADLRAKNAELMSRLASATQPAAGPAKSPELDKMQAELSDLKSKNDELTAKLSAAQAAAQAKTAAAPAADDKTLAELDKLRKDNLALNQRLLTIVNSEPQPLPSHTPAAQVQARIAANQDKQRAQVQAQQAEIASLEAQKRLLEQQLSTGHVEAAPVPAVAQAALPPTASAMAKLQPAAGDAATPSFVTPQHATAAAAPAAPDAAEAAPAAEAGFDENRAAAFLDRIMAYHHPAGEEAPAHAKHGLADEAPVFADPKPPAAPVTPVAEYHPPIVSQPVHVRAEYRPPVVAAVPHVDPVMTAMPDEDTPATAAPAPAPVRSQPTVSPAPQLAAAAQAPVAKLWGDSSAPVSLEGLLSASGIDAQVKAGQSANIRQWTSGGINGMYEQLPPGDFTSQAHQYIERYRQDCPHGLSVNMGQPQTTAAGTFAEANVSCSMASNAYSTSFVFVQDSKKFGAILHTGYPADSSKVRNLGDNIAYALGSSGGLLAPSAAVRKAEADVPAYRVPSYPAVEPSASGSDDAAPAQPVQHHFNIPQEVKPVGSSPNDGLDTVVVQ